MTKKTVFWLALALTLVSLASALDEFEVDARPVTSLVFFDGVDTAIINVTITNNQDKAVSYTIDSPNVPDWDFSTEPRTDYAVSIEPHQKRLVVVHMRPLYVGFALYRIFIDVKSSDTGSRIRSVVPVEVQMGVSKQLEYLPDVRMNATLSPSEVDPREDLTVHLTVRNNNPRNIDRLNVDVISLRSQQHVTYSLRAFEEREERITLHFDPLTMPATDAVTITANTVSGNDTYRWEISPLPFSIKGYSELEVQKSEEHGFLRKGMMTIYTNRGNIERSTLVKEDISPLIAIFTKTEPAAKLTSEQGRFAYFWNVNLKPETEQGPDTLTIAVRQNYMPLLYAGIIILIIILGYFKFRSPVIVKKQLVEVHRSEDKAGGIFRLKVVIHIKNRTKNPFEQLKVVDHIPNITELEGDFAVGTIKPTKIVAKHARATLVIWELQNLEPFEERIITYQLKSSLHIIGGIDLPPAVVKFKDRRGVMMSQESNKIEFF